MSLASAFVDDGLCDCCDGSDEIHGCSNRCLEESAPVVQELKDKLNVYTNALQKKGSFEQQAVAKKAHWQQRAQVISDEILSAATLVDAARAEKDKATEHHKNAQADVAHLEAKAKEEREQRRLQEEAAAAELASQQPEPTDEATPTPATEHVDQQVEEPIPQVKLHPCHIIWLRVVLPLTLV